MVGIREPGDPGYNPETARHANRLYGKFKARVMNVGDPNEVGRVKLFIPGLMSGPATNVRQQTDWASPIAIQGEYTGDDEVGGVNVPPVGSLVWAEFEQGLFDFPQYHGGFWRRGKKVPKLARGEDETPTTNATAVTVGPATVPATTAGSSVYPLNRMFRTPAGHIIEIDDTEGKARIRIRHKSGTQIEIQEDGKLVIHGVEDIGLAGINLDMAAQAALTLAATTITTLDGQASAGIKLGASATEAVVKGDVRYTAERTFLTALSVYIGIVKGATLATQIAIAATAFEPALIAWKAAVDSAAHLSTKAKTE